MTLASHAAFLETIMIEPTEHNIRSALSYVSPDLDQKQWAIIGMSIKDAGLHNGFELFDDWSSNGSTYDKNAVKTVWRSIKDGGAVTIGTLFGLARDNGWKPDSDHYQETEQERHEREAKRAKLQEQEAAETQRKHEQAAEKTNILGNNAKPAEADHPYLIRKGINPVKTLYEIHVDQASKILGYTPKCNGVELVGRLLMARIRIDGFITSTEFIDERGKKSAVAGGAKSGGFYSVRPLPYPPADTEIFIIGEGVATVISAFEASKHVGVSAYPVAALSASNLPKVASAFRNKYPNAKLIILADTGNGQDYAETAAIQTHAQLIVPSFTPAHISKFIEVNGKEPKDLNDLHLIAGLDEAAKQINFFSQQSKNTAQTAQNLIEQNKNNDLENSEQHSNSTRTAQTETNSTKTALEQHEQSVKDKEEIEIGDFVCMHFNEKGEKRYRLKVESKAAKIMADSLREKNFAYNNSAMSWHKYTGYCWTPLILPTEPENEIMQLLYDGTNPLGFKMAYFSGVIQIMLRANLLPLPPEPIGKIPFKNGLLDMTTKELTPIGKHNAATWAIPHDYHPHDHCPVFMQWLTTATENDQDTVQLLRAYINACLIGRADLQKFLMLLGSAGTGKSTFIRLLFAMLGETNCATTDLRNLEENKFETASIYGKRLTAITDSSKYGGSVDVLKALTGQDPVRNEKKNVQQSGTYIYEGMVLIASNEPIASTDYTSGLDRRRLVVKFDRRIKPDEKMHFMELGGEEQLHREIPAIINWALQLTNEQVTNLFMNPPQKSKDAAFESLTAQNPVAEWISDNLILDEQAKSFVGVREESKTSSGVTVFEFADTKLYPNYLRWCNQNKRESLAKRRFTHTLIDMLQTMGWEDHKDKPRHADGLYLCGVRIRHQYEKQHDWQTVRGGI